MKKAEKKNIIAIIPARGGSKGIPKKNIMKFCGKPLIVWSIEQALGSKFIDGVYVSSDDKEILEISRKAGADIIERPEELAGDKSSAEEALLHAINHIEYAHKGKTDIVILLQATSPVRFSEDIDNAIRFFIDQKADSLFSATELEDFCVWEIKKNELNSLTYNYKNRGRRQDRKPYYLENGSFYIFKTDILKKYNNRLGRKITFYKMPLWKSYEIDKIEDVRICEYYMMKNILGDNTLPV